MLFVVNVLAFETNLCAQSSLINHKTVFIFQEPNSFTKRVFFSDSQLLKGAIGKEALSKEVRRYQIMHRYQSRLQIEVSAISGVHDSDTKYGLVIPEVKNQKGCVPTFVKKRISSYILILTPFFLYFTSYRICAMKHFKIWPPKMTTIVLLFQLKNIFILKTSNETEWSQYILFTISIQL